VPEYLAPGVYVEEVSFRSKSIEGVGTSTTAFVGPTLKGPADSTTPELLTSFSDFERIYGGIDDLAYGNDDRLNRNYVAHAVQAYFNNGGARLYVVRVYTPGTGTGIATAKASPVLSTTANNVTTPNAWFEARFPGATFNGAGVIVQQKGAPIRGKSLENAPDGTVVRVHPAKSANWVLDGNTWKVLGDDGTPGADVQNPGVGTASVWLIAQVPDGGTDAKALDKPIALDDTAFHALKDKARVRIFPAAEVWLREDGAWTRVMRGGTAVSGNDAEVKPADLAGVGRAYAITMDVEFRPASGDSIRFEDLSPVAGMPRDTRIVLGSTPQRRADDLANPVALVFSDNFTAKPADLLRGLVGAQPVTNPFDAYDEPQGVFTLTGGDDGAAPAVAQYADGFGLLVGLEDVSIVAAPGYSARDKTTGDYQGIQDALLTHVSNPRRYRIGVLDSPPDETPSSMRELRGLVDSTRAAMYYPWVVVSNPLAGPRSSQPAEIMLPPSGFVCGIYARNDIERGVWKAPANEIVRGALRFERQVNHGEQELLNPIGVNCLRYLQGRGFRVWGARTISSDPEWKYVNVRRYFNYLEASIDRGTQWVVFEPNGEMLWANVRGTVADFLLAEWKSGALLGTKQDEAFFVRCDRTTMTQNDLDNGRLVCLIGVAVVKPAEFVIFRIGQKTADAKS